MMRDRAFGLNLRRGSLNPVGREPVWFDPRAALFRSDSYLFWPGRLAGTSVVINRWPNCPAHIFEIFAENHLRSTLGLADGDQVEISGPPEMLDQARCASFKHRLSWRLLWYLREGAYYHSEPYNRLIQMPLIRRRLWRSSQ